MDARWLSRGSHDGREPETKEKERDRGTVGGPNRLVVVKKQGCDWGACGRPRRRDLATLLALRDGRGEGGSARGQGPRD